ncbi:TetR/AcrR family transcriptional regulator [uncultured Corynebacterium sp.]|uniref:TetR/AcrR family transcriptional regulator n=1 Tax=uncultured Corynebacterium sp. TaxID=159447 RepID=UPI0025EC8A9C|nr:TetR/AcrR family transcriptional regulator [uncultured Corynebacterium sp.]
MMKLMVHDYGSWQKASNNYPRGTAATHSQETLSPKAAARRADILDAARKVFTTDGYHHTKLTKIAEVAGCSVGTLYTYFEDRQDLLMNVLASVEEDLNPTLDDSLLSIDDARATVIHSNREFVRFYANNAGAMNLVAQSSQFTPELADRQMQIAKQMVGRNRRMLEAMIAKNMIPPLEDVEYTAAAIAAMFTRFCHATFIQGFYEVTDENREEIVERTIKTLSLMTFRMVGMEDTKPGEL